MLREPLNEIVNSKIDDAIRYLNLAREEPDTAHSGKKECALWNARDCIVRAIHTIP